MDSCRSQLLSFRAQRRQANQYWHKAHVRGDKGTPRISFLHLQITRHVTVAKQETINCRFRRISRYSTVVLGLKRTPSSWGRRRGRRPQHQLLASPLSIISFCRSPLAALSRLMLTRWVISHQVEVTQSADHRRTVVASKDSTCMVEIVRCRPVHQVILIR